MGNCTVAVKYKSSDKGLRKMQRSANDLQGRKVNVGYLEGGEMAWLAGIHEYGCHIEVTPEMRAYLHHHGLHLKRSTTEIVIPERSFLRAGWDEHHQEVIKKTDPLLADVLGGTMSADQFCETVGLLLKSKVQDYARDLKNPANHPFTKKQKGSGNPLVDSGDMINALSYEVEK